VLWLTGENSKHAQKLVDRFTNDPGIQFFVANMTVGGQGLNLQVAAHVLIAELNWSPAIMEQCEDRCHRKGQTRPVKVVYFVLKDSIEEIMVAALGRKLTITRVALNPQRPHLASPAQGDVCGCDRHHNRPKGTYDEDLVQLTRMAEEIRLQVRSTP
jgi:hypothetical protein